MGFVEPLVRVALGRHVHELDVVVGGGGVKAPVGGVGKHHLLLEAQFLAFEEDPLVGGADDRLAADEQVGLNRDLPVEAGFLHPNHVGDLTQPLQPRRAHDDPELRRVVEHHRQASVIGQQPDKVDDLLLHLRDEVRSGDDQQVEAHRFGVLRQRQHILGRGVGDVGGDGPLSPDLVADDLINLHPLVQGQAPELAHPPGTPRAPDTQPADVPNVVPQRLFVQRVLGGKGSDQGGPLAAQVFPGPLPRLALRVVGHCNLLPLDDGSGLELSGARSSLSL